jgi:hypothetical protein
VEKIKHLFEKILHLSGVGGIVLLSNKCSKTFPKVVYGRSKTMSTMTLSSKVSDLQGFQANPSGGIKLNRRGRLARTLVVLSLAIVAASVAGGQAGASTASKTSATQSFITVTVAPGDTVWSLANRVGEGSDSGALVSAIIEINGLGNGDLSAGQKIRIPL